MPEAVIRGLIRQVRHGLKACYQQGGRLMIDSVGSGGAFTLVITNDPDHADLDHYRRVFLGLNSLGLKVTTSVFCTMRKDGSDLARHCYRGETQTLEDPAFREFMLDLQEQGHEIAFHGYSQVSDTREQFADGLEFFKEIFGHYPFTYIEHGGNPHKHPLGMCKKETLALEGMTSGSPHYIVDLIKEKLGCVWAWHDLLDDDSGVKNVDDLLYWREGVLFFRRCRLHYLERMVKGLADTGGVFIGYTHFGYDGYSKLPEFRLENWTGHHLARALKILERVMSRHQITNCTLKELVIGRMAQGYDLPTERAISQSENG